MSLSGKDHQRSTRAALKVDLRDKIIYETSKVKNICTRILKINKFDNGDIRRCIKSIKRNHSKDIKRLHRLAEQASRKKVQRAKPTSQDVEMHELLVDILNRITDFRFTTTDNGDNVWTYSDSSDVDDSPLIDIDENGNPLGDFEEDGDPSTDNRQEKSDATTDKRDNDPTYTEKGNVKGKGRDTGNGHDEGKSDNKRKDDHVSEGNDADPDPPLRRFHKTTGTVKLNTPQHFAHTRLSPDISVFDVSSPLKPTFWDDCDAFVEVKASIQQGFKSARGRTIPPLVIQAADYARVLLAARPFMLFCVGVLVFGTEFYVGIFDRDGITLSPSYDMFGKDISTFVRVIRAITRLQITQLGFDPTVQTLAKGTQRVLLTEESDKARNPHSYPSHLVTVSDGRGSERIWCTISHPLWTSQSLLGRGTNVWHVREYMASTHTLQGPQMILKGAWRNSHRLKESDIYRLVQNKLPHQTSHPTKVAQWVCGGDVLFPDSPFPITVDNLRNPKRARRNVDPPQSGEGKSRWPPTRTLHRLVLSSVGKLLFEYTSEKELLEGFRDALQGHEILYNNGVLHRDISIGNIFIGQNGGGFVADLDCAYITSENIVVPTAKSTAHAMNMDTDDMPEVNVTDKEEQLILKIKRGIEITGTTQFMASELLQQANRLDGVKIPHAVHHDIESFIWALCYAVLTWLLKRVEDGEIPLRKLKAEAEREALLLILSEAFSQTNPREIRLQRHSCSIAIEFPESGRIPTVVKRLMSTHLIRLFYDLRRLIHSQSELLFTPIPLTHALVLEAVNKALSGINGEMMNVDSE